MFLVDNTRFTELKPMHIFYFTHYIVKKGYNAKMCIKRVIFIFFSTFAGCN